MFLASIRLFHPTRGLFYFAFSLHIFHYVPPPRRHARQSNDQQRTSGATHTVNTLLLSSRTRNFAHNAANTRTLIESHTPSTSNALWGHNIEDSLIERLLQTAVCPPPPTRVAPPSRTSIKRPAAGFRCDRCHDKQARALPPRTKYQVVTMAKQQEKEPANAVHLDAILTETIKKQRRHQKMYKNFTINPFSPSKYKIRRAVAWFRKELTSRLPTGAYRSLVPTGASVAGTDWGLGRWYRLGPRSLVPTGASVAGNDWGLCRWYRLGPRSLVVVPTGAYRSLVTTGAYRSLVPTGAYRSLVPTGAYRSLVTTGAYRSLVPTGAYRSLVPTGASVAGNDWGLSVAGTDWGLGRW